MKLYLAAYFNRQAEMRELRRELRRMGHVVTSRWLDDEGPRATPEAMEEEPKLFAEKAWRDFEDIDEADVLVCFNGSEPSAGRHVELGYAFNSEATDIWIVGEPQTPFHVLPDVTRFKTVQDFLNDLADQL